MPAAAGPVGLVVRVPGSTSNLGPGFDALGLALDVELRLDVARAADDAAPGSVTWDFGDRAAPDDNAIDLGFRALGTTGLGACPALTVRVASDIPVKAGLGSSAAAIVAGLRLREAVAGSLGRQRLLDAAAQLEGHPDNTSPSILGGFVAACLTRDGRVAAIARPWPDDLRVMVATPEVTVATKAARRVLPAHVPLADAVANVQRTAVLVQALAAGDRRFLREAFRDRLHQPYRAALVPGLEAALAFDHPSLWGVFLSGAGPSIAAIVDDDGRSVRGLFEELYARLGLQAAVRLIRVVQPFDGAGSEDDGGVRS
jgi:homoserine kinase